MEEMERNGLINELEEVINDVIFNFQNKEHITNGESHFELEMAISEKIEALADSIISLIEYQKSWQVSIPVEYIEEEYCDTSDTTFLVKYIYLNGNLKSREVISFYSGEPNAEDTKHYSTKGLGVKCEYEL